MPKKINNIFIPASNEPGRHMKCSEGTPGCLANAERFTCCFQKSRHCPNLGVNTPLLAAGYLIIGWVQNEKEEKEEEKNMHKFFIKRILALTLSICMIAGMIDLSGFTVRAAGVELGGIQVIDAEMEYTGSPLIPSIEVTDVNGNVLTEGTDYEVAVSSNVNVGTGTIRVTNKTNTVDVLNGSFRIVQRNLATYGEVADVEEKFVLPDAPMPVITVIVRDTVRDIELPSTEYTSDVKWDVSGGKGIITVNGRSNYTGTITKEFKVTELNKDNLTFDFEGGSVRFTYPTAAGGIKANPVKPPIDENSVKYDGKLLTKGVDYDVDYRDNTAPGTAKALVIGKGNYAGIIAEKEFTIVKNLSKDYGEFTVKVEPITEPRPYTGLAVTFKDEDIKVYDPDVGYLRPGVDYTIDQNGYTDNIEETIVSGREATITVEGRGAYSNILQPKPTFKIEAARLSKDIVEINDDKCIYDRTEQVKNLVVTVQGYTKGVDYDYQAVGDDTNAGTKRIKISPLPAGKLKGDPIEMEYEIQPCPLDSSRISIRRTDTTNHIYDGSQKKVQVELVLTCGDNQTYKLLPNVDYQNELQYSDNINAGDNAQAWAVAITGKNFTGESNHVTFSIEQADLNEAGKTKITGVASQIYEPEGATLPSLKVQYGSKPLTKDTDYMVAYENNLEVGTATVTITGQKNYKGTFTENFEITSRPLTNGVQIDNIPNQEYMGVQITPEVSLKYKTETLVLDKDFTVEYGENLNAGSTGTVKITGTGNYSGTVEKKFTIDRRNIEQAELIVLDLDKGGVNVNELPDGWWYTYTGQPISPRLEVTYTKDTYTKTLEQGTGKDCIVTISKNKDIGVDTAEVKIEGIGNFSGTKTLHFSIKGDLENTNFTKITIADQIYTHNPITAPKGVVVTFDGKEVASDQYTVTTTNNENVGTAYASITGQGAYYGTVTDQEFKIVPFDLSKLEEELEAGNQYLITGVEKDYIYSGFPINPVPTITHNGADVVLDSDYEIDDCNDAEGVDNVNANEETPKGKLIIKAKESNGNYIGEYEMKYTIHPYDISTDYGNASKIEVTGVKDVILDDVIAGTSEDAELKDNPPDRVVMKNLQVMYTPLSPDGNAGDEKPLNQSTECEIKYDKNFGIQIAEITVTGKGNFTGTLTRNFKIQGDLKNVELKLEKCIYSPKGNVPKHTAAYSYEIRGQKYTIDLVEDTDYRVECTDNTDATAKSGTLATFKLLPKEDTGAYIGEQSVQYEIEQRNLAGIVSPDDSKDPDLSLDGLNEEGYEYTGSEIVPELSMSCEGIALTRKDAVGGSEYDFEVSAINNINVYTFGEDSNGGRERLFPTVTVTARQADGKYVGNYKGSFQKRFVINPRKLSKETIDTDPEIWGIDENQSYSGLPITFPDPEHEGKNRILVTWSKGGVSTSLIEGQDYSVGYKDNVKIGEAKVLIQEVPESNYALEDKERPYEKPFKIRASIEVVQDPNPPLKYMTLEYNENVPYGAGENVYPELIFKDLSAVLDENDPTTEPKILEKDVDFEIVTSENKGDAPWVSSNNQDVRSKDDPDETKRPCVVVRGKDPYLGVIRIFYTITPKDLSADDITADFMGSTVTEDGKSTYIYTGEEIRPELIVYNGKKPMLLGTDYTIEEYGNNIDVSTEETRAYVRIKAVEGGNYVGEKILYFDIVKRSIENMNVSIEGDPQIFDRTEKTPEVRVSYIDGGTNEEVVLTKDDYDIVYENNINAASAEGELAPTAVITGKGDYSGTIRKTFEILPESFELAEGQEDDFEIQAENAIYTGNPVTTTIEVKAKDGTLLEEGVDYLLGDYTDNTNIGTGYIAITGMGNYTGTRQVPFRIVPADGKIQVGEIPDQIYNSYEIMPKPQVVFKVEGLEGVEDMEFPLTEGEDYELSYANNINVGTASLTVTGTGNFPGTATADFKIVSRSINVSGDDGLAKDMTLEDIEDQIYTGRGVTPDVNLTFHRGQRSEEETDQKLILNRDYTLSYAANVSVGMAEVSITGIGNFTGKVQTQFRILGPLTLATVADIPIQQYTGSPIEPKPQITFTGTELKENEDYTLTYENNINRGTATITIEGMGWYTGIRKVSFDIAREFNEETQIRGIAAAYTYTGAEIAPVVRVEDDGAVLSKDRDYQISYSDNLNVGTATITITGINKYRGSKSVTFKIIPQNISRATVSSVADQIYTKTEIKPSVQVSKDGALLQEGIDYKVGYADNRYPGTGKVIVHGDGNYTGSQAVNFKIEVPKVTGVKASKYTSASITFAWTRNKVVSGYEIYNSKNKLQVRVKKNSTTKVVVKKLKAGSVSTFRVRAFVIRGGRYHYSEFVKIKAGTGPKAASISSLTSKKSKRAVIKWKKIKGVTTYQVYRSTSKKGKYTRIASTNKASYTDKKVKGGKKYFYKIRTGKKSGTKTYYSDYSKVKSVKVKK